MSQGIHGQHNNMQERSCLRVTPHPPFIAFWGFQGFKPLVRDLAPFFGLLSPSTLILAPFRVLAPFGGLYLLGEYFRLLFGVFKPFSSSLSLFQGREWVSLGGVGHVELSEGFFGLTWVQQHTMIIYIRISSKVTNTSTFPLNQEVILSLYIHQHICSCLHRIIIITYSQSLHHSCCHHLLTI